MHLRTTVSPTLYGPTTPRTSTPDSSNTAGTLGGTGMWNKKVYLFTAYISCARYLWFKAFFSVMYFTDAWYQVAG